MGSSSPSFRGENSKKNIQKNPPPHCEFAPSHGGIPIDPTKVLPRSKWLSQRPGKSDKAGPKKPIVKKKD